MKCEAVFANSSSYSVRKMCQVPWLREAMYDCRKKAEERRNRRIREEREDIPAVKEVFEDNHRIYGCRGKRLHSTLGYMSPVACRLQHCRAGTA